MCNTKSTNPIDDLNTSPMFNLSLSSKELFHSNFLAWLGNNSDTREFFVEVINLLVEDLNLQYSGGWTVMREDKHFDLCIREDTKKGKGKGKYLLIIENKVKSIPLKRQLDEYVKKDVRWKDGQKKYLLLTLTEKFAHRTKIDKAIKTIGYPNNWIVKTYKDLAGVMRKNQELVNKTNLRYLLEDYIGFIENLDALVRDWQDEKYFAQEWNDIPKLKDIHAKIQFSRYCEKLKKEYLSELSDIIVYDDDSIPDPKDVDAKKIYVNVHWGYASRGQEGIFDIEIPLNWLNSPLIVTGLKLKDGKAETPYCIKIQVQGRNYRHVIETNTDFTDNTVDDELIKIGRNKPYTDDSGLNFFSKDPLDSLLDIPDYGNDGIFDDGPRLYPVNKGTGKNQIPDERWPFASYKDKNEKVQFIYQSRNIKKNEIKIDDVLKNITAEVERILGFFSKVTSP